LRRGEGRRQRDPGATGSGDEQATAGAGWELLDVPAQDLAQFGRDGRQARGSARPVLESGLLAVPGSIAVVALSIVEPCVLWAVHCRFDPTPPATSQRRRRGP
jgi:hypothetical protein